MPITAASSQSRLSWAPSVQQGVRHKISTNLAHENLSTPTPRLAHSQAHRRAHTLSLLHPLHLLCSLGTSLQINDKSPADGSLRNGPSIDPDTPRGCASLSLKAPTFCVSLHLDPGDAAWETRQICSKSFCQHSRATVSLHISTIIFPLLPAIAISGHTPSHNCRIARACHSSGFGVREPH